MDFIILLGLLTPAPGPQPHQLQRSYLLGKGASLAPVIGTIRIFGMMIAPGMMKFDFLTTESGLMMDTGTIMRIGETNG